MKWVCYADVCRVLNSFCCWNEMHRSYCVLCFHMFYILYTSYVHVYVSAYLLAATFTDYHTMNDFNLFPFCDNLGPYLKKNVVSSSHVDKTYHMHLFSSCCLPYDMFSGCWVNVMWNILLHVLWPAGLLVAPPRASCLSHKARHWSWICTTRMIWPRKMRTWAGERWKIWWHSCNGLPQGGQHEQLIGLYT